ncbi:MULTISPECIES: 5-bromo-4-chloroindolyl phosphate hydrolysis family protein [environmental samples]|uniref:5-bromo-4-chloroindolyl phosphate hydrolysis family protein n=1 Tax=environmental samples TaxID=876090 RepID=UPI0003391A81|nr:MULTISPECIES: 5-bromo-4-chloroindolyl phosphate hydrolysis family protein [environmental samples]CDC67962.1 putative uncharacterized protein [Oscillibacter sp. CAG:155]
MAAKRKSDSDWVSWVVIAVLFLVGLAPIALVVLLVKLFGRDGKQRTQAPPLQTDLPRQSAAGQPGRAQQAARKVTRSPAVKKSNAKKLKIVGIVVAAIGILGVNDPIDALFWSDYWMELYFLDLLQYLAVAAAGVALFCGGVSMDRQLKRYEKYLAVLGDREAMPVEELARTLGYPEKRVERDLGKMIDKGYFGGTAYLNMELGYLFRSGKADEALKRQRQKEQTTAQQPPKEAEEGYSGILRGIRRANDAIADPVLSAKIDRLEEITSKIFRAVEEDPRKKDRIGTFLNYYLPTTQKLLDSYAEFEAAGVEGENLRQAKSRIASTMDSIVAGFEHQLDELYKADALDVDSDIRVMETILKRDTASAARDFGLEDQGGEAVQQKPE